MSEKKNSDIIKQEDHAPVKKNSTFEEFNENTLRVRRNLLIFSVIALFYKLSGATLTGKSSFLGLEFEHIDPEMIDLFLLCIVGYHFIHFFWLVYENFHHYIIRRYTAMIGVDNKEAILFSSTKKIVEKMKKEYEQFKITNSEMDKKIENAENYIKENVTKLEIFKNKFEAIEIKMKELESFKKESEARFIKINNWRYFLIETSLPLLIGCFAVFVLENL